MRKVRAEQARVRPDPTATITGGALNGMAYARQVVKEVLRYRPPAPMVPQVRRLDLVAWPPATLQGALRDCAQHARGSRKVAVPVAALPKQAQWVGPAEVGQRFVPLGL